MQGGDLTAPDKCVAGLCHYPGQSEPLSGLERGAMDISERKLREVFLPPWEAGIRRAGALGVMATYPAIDGDADARLEMDSDRHFCAANSVSTGSCSPRAAVSTL